MLINSDMALMSA